MAKNQIPKTGDRTVANRARWRRLDLNLSQEGVARRMSELLDAENGIGQTYVSQIENAQIWTTAERLRALARALETTVAYLMGENDNPMLPSERLERLGLGQGNLKGLGDEEVILLVARLAEELHERDRGAASGRKDVGQALERGSDSTDEEGAGRHA